MVAELTERLGLKMAPAAYIVGAVAQLFVWGWLRGSYLPEQFIATGTREQREAILSPNRRFYCRPSWAAVTVWKPSPPSETMSYPGRGSVDSPPLPFARNPLFGKGFGISWNTSPTRGTVASTKAAACGQTTSRS
jgi:hypothetical protein